MAGNDVHYYERRAEAEIEMARQADDSRVVQAHYDLATYYLDKIHGEGEPESG